MDIFEDLELLNDPGIELIEDIIPDRVYNLRQRPDHFNNWNDKEFYNRFRLSKGTVEWILEQIEIDLQNQTEWNINRAVSTMDKLLLTQRFLATGDFYISMGDFVGIQKTTAGRIINQGIRAICNLFPQYVNLPRSQEAQEAVKRYFYNISHFLRVIGAIDCTHIKIQSPGGGNSEVYRNRKRFFSLNCQVVCNAKLKIIDLVSRWPGSAAHDSHIFQNSALKMTLQNQEMGIAILVADRGYVVKSYMLTPLDNPQNEAETLYNEAQIRTRNVIERMFGIWKRRFPILSVGIRCKLELVQMVIAACAVLHNIAIEHNEVFEIEDNFEDFQEDAVDNNVLNGDDGACITFINYFQNLLNTRNNN